MKYSLMFGSSYTLTKTERVGIRAHVFRHHKNTNISVRDLAQ